MMLSPVFPERDFGVRGSDPGVATDVAGPLRESGLHCRHGSGPAASSWRSSAKIWYRCRGGRSAVGRRSGSERSARAMREALRKVRGTGYLGNSDFS